MNEMASEYKQKIFIEKVIGSNCTTKSLNGCVTCWHTMGWYCFYLFAKILRKKPDYLLGLLVPMVLWVLSILYGSKLRLITYEF